MKTLLKIFLLTLTLMLTSSAQAQVVTGYAPIVNGNIDGARRDARNRALREAVESAVGVKIQSTTEVANMLVVKDEIIAKSEGFVTIDRVLREEVRGEIFFIELDVTASADRIRTFARDLRSQLEANVNDSNSRGGIMVAVVRRNSDGTCSYDAAIGDYINDKLKAIGLKPYVNDSVNAYIARHADDPDVRVHARTIARDNREAENALLRGVTGVESVRKVAGLYEATVNVSFELIGLDSSDVDVYTRTAVGVGSTRQAAIDSAKEVAVREAIDSLARQALETVQDETRGGYTNIKTTVIVEGVTDYDAQLPLIQSAFDAAGCTVIRMTRPAATRLAFFVSSIDFATVNDLQVALLNSIPHIKLGITPAGEHGSTKIHLTF
ncbi:MAG: hypothetical protein SR2Q5_05320 [Quinella sp. 2Q5]|nr:hypothetical protein [Quinella sp. 2Q5]